MRAGAGWRGSGPALPYVREPERTNESWILGDEGERQPNQSLGNGPAAGQRHQKAKHVPEKKHSETGEARQRVDSMCDEGNNVLAVPIRQIRKVSGEEPVGKWSDDGKSGHLAHEQPES